MHIYIVPDLCMCTEDEKKRSQTKTDVDEVRAGSGSSNVPLSTPAHPRLMDSMPAAHDILATQVNYYLWVHVL